MPDFDKVKTRMPVMVIRTYEADEFGKQITSNRKF